MLQTALVLALFSTAAFYLGRQFYREFFVKESPCEGCAIAKLHQFQQSAAPGVKKH